MFWRKAAAWGVHFYTSLGALCGVASLIYASDHRPRATFFAMWLATWVDSTDGSLARICEVERVLPKFNGALLDNIVDYLTYVVVPAFAMNRFGILPPGLAGCLLVALILVASAYGFCRSDAKTDDHYFLGFPSYWNIVALYLFCLKLSAFLSSIAIITLALMVFTRLKFIYPSRTRPLRRLTLILSTIWGILVFVILLELPNPNSALVYSSLGFVIYYFVASLALQLGSGLRRFATEATA